MSVSRKWFPLAVIGCFVALAAFSAYRLNRQKHERMLLADAASAIRAGDSIKLTQAIATLDPDALYGANGTPSLGSQIMGDHEIEHGRHLLLLACGSRSMISAGRSCAPLVKALLDHGASANVSDAYARTPLMVACQYGDVQAVKLLLDHGARPQKRDLNGFSPLFLSVHNRATPERRQIVAMLLAHGAEPDADTMGGTPIMLTTDYETVKSLVEAGANINRGWHGVTPLMRAARVGDARTVELLIQHGALVDAQDSRGMDAAAYAKADHHPDIVKLLTHPHH